MTVLTLEMLQDEMQLRLERLSTAFQDTLREQQLILLKGVRSELESIFSGSRAPQAEGLFQSHAKRSGSHIMTGPHMARTHSMKRKPNLHEDRPKLQRGFHMRQTYNFQDEDADSNDFEVHTQAPTVMENSIALEPQVLHWKKAKPEPGHRARPSRTSNQEGPESLSMGEDASLFSSALPDSRRETIALQVPKESVNKPELMGGATKPMSCAAGRSAWEHRHNDSYRSLALVQQRVTGDYQLLPSPDLEGGEEVDEDQKIGRLSRGKSVEFDLTNAGLAIESQPSQERNNPSALLKSGRSRTFHSETDGEQETSGWMTRYRKVAEKFEIEEQQTAYRGNSFTSNLPSEWGEEEELRFPWLWACLNREQLEETVNSTRFNLGTGILVILNAVLIGVQTHYMAITWSLTAPPICVILDKVFCGCFVLELTLRFWAFGCRFFYMVGWHWNIFDFTIVTMQVFEVYAETQYGNETQWKYFSDFRTLRLLRILRLARILHLIDELRMILVSISQAVRSLVWVVILLFCMIYGLAVYLTQIVTDHKVHRIDNTSAAVEEELQNFFGSLDRSVLSLYAVVSDGIHWDTLMIPLAEQISPWLRLVFFFFSALAVLAVMNVVTGVFVESALRTAAEDKKISIARHLHSLFASKMYEDITWETFEDNLYTPEMRVCLHEMDVGTEDAYELFRLLDIDNSGAVDVDELVHGSLRLMGYAKAIDLATFMNEYRITTLRWAKHARFVESCLDFILESMSEGEDEGDDATTPEPGWANSGTKSFADSGKSVTGTQDFNLLVSKMSGIPIHE